MKYSLTYLLKEEGASEHLDFQIDPKEFVKEYDFPDLAKVSADVVNTGNEIQYKGNISGKFDGTCARCLAPVSQEFSYEFDELFPYEDFDLNPELDVSEIALEYLSASLPLKVLCSDDCPGIEIQEEKEIDPRFEALKKLKQS